MKVLHTGGNYYDDWLLIQDDEGQVYLVVAETHGPVYQVNRCSDGSKVHDIQVFIDWVGCR